MPRTPTSALDWGALPCDFRSRSLSHADLCRLRGIPPHTFRRRLC
jgi:hypothetical protein